MVAGHEVFGEGFGAFELGDGFGGREAEDLGVAEEGFNVVYLCRVSIALSCKCNLRVRCFTLRETM